MVDNTTAIHRQIVQLITINKLNNDLQQVRLKILGTYFLADHIMSSFMDEVQTFDNQLLWSEINTQKIGPGYRIL